MAPKVSTRLFKKKTADQTESKSPPDESVVEQVIADNCPLASFDMFLVIPKHELKVGLERLVVTKLEPDVKAEESGKDLGKRVISLLKMALSDRIIELGLIKETIKELMFGIVLNPVGFMNELDKGPIANKEEEAAEFRRFWGSKSELRRFRDGQICETIAWPASNLCERRLIVMKIIKWALETHAGLPRSFCHVTGGELDRFLVPQPIDGLNYGTGEELMDQINEKFDKLSTIMRSHNDEAALQITSIYGIDPVFRKTPIFVSLPAQYQHWKKKCTRSTRHNILFKGDIESQGLDQDRLPLYLYAHDVLISLESTGQWSSDEGAISRLKAALLSQFASLLRNKNALPTVVTTDYFDVMVDGFIFRVRIACNKEKLTASPFFGYKQARYSYVVLPKVTSTLLSISQKFPSYGLICRLAKRWLASQMLSDYLEEPVVDLLVASMFTNIRKRSPPTSAFCGLLRITALLAHWDWVSKPLIVNLNDLLGSEEIRNHEREFALTRASHPPMTIWTPYDIKGSHWTRQQPVAVVLDRITLLAKKANEFLLASLSSAPGNMSALFSPSTACYDMIIKLNPLVVSRYHERVEQPTNPKKISQLTAAKRKGEALLDGVLPVVAFDPVARLVADLRELLGDRALIFRDEFGGLVIGISWNPNKLNSVHESEDSDELMATLSGSKSQSANSYELDMEAALQDIQMLGGALIHSVQVNHERLLTITK